MKVAARCLTEGDGINNARPAQVRYARNFGIPKTPDIGSPDAELGAKIFCAVTLIGLPLGFTLGCIVVLRFFS